MVTSADIVARSSLVNSPRTMLTMLVSCTLDFSPYSFKEPATMASVTSLVQCTCDPAMTTCPGQSKIHSSLGFVV